MLGSTATVDGQAATAAAAADEAACLLGQARRVLVTGLADAPLETIAAACDLAELLGAAIDVGSADAASPAGPTLPRAGAVTADLAELRDRADLVIAWFCEAETLPSELLADPRGMGRQSGDRRCLAVGPEPIAGFEHLWLPAESAVDAARLLHAILDGHESSTHQSAAAVIDGCLELANAIRRAALIGFLAGASTDPLGLDRWAVSLLVRFLAHDRPAFMVPLAAAAGCGTSLPQQNAAGATAMLTWRYGAAGGIARADRGGSDFRPGECTATRLITRGEVDAVLAVGRLPSEIEEAIASRAADLAVIRLDCSATPPPGAAGRCVHFSCSPPVGTVPRADSREATVGDPATASDAFVELLTAIQAHLKEAGKRP